MDQNWKASATRYQAVEYKRCGKSGIKIPPISLGLWHNFGGIDVYENARDMVLRSFDAGIVHFDLANNYGPPPGSAELCFGRILAKDLLPHRDELLISSKAGWGMWDGPYGDFGSRKYLVASCDQSLARMGLDYVDIFYSHRPDPETPLEETMGALDYIVRSGRALYAGISSYGPQETKRAAAILKSMGTPCLIHQPSYSMFNRWIEDGLTDVLKTEGIGAIVFSPLAQGMLSNRYLNGIPNESRAGKGGFLKPADLNPLVMTKIKALNDIAQARGQSLSQLAIQWVLRDPVVCSALVGASSWQQIEDNLGALGKPDLDSVELGKIEAVLRLSQ